jgi:serine/threonine-protein kinase HipA
VTTSCLTCLRPVSDGTRHHARCARRLFGTDVAPRLDLRQSEIQTVALATIGRSSLAGVQPKISVGFHTDRRTLQLETNGGRFILKPPAPNFEALPENEHLTMELARRFGLSVPDTTLIELGDGKLAYLIARYDRPITGGKLRQEDFCQLLLLPPAAKYDRTALDCASVIRRFSTEPLADLFRLFETFVFAFWVANGDMHLKNLSLAADTQGRHLLSPAYDQVCTGLYPDFDANLGLPLSPDDRKTDRAAWLRFAHALDIPERAAVRVLNRPTDQSRAALTLIAESYLPHHLQAQYRRILDLRAAALTA